MASAKTSVRIDAYADGIQYVQVSAQEVIIQIFHCNY